jgi:hypothetical protein
MIVEEILSRVPPLVVDMFGAASCVAQARVASDVLQHFKVPARAVPCQVVAVNAEGMRVLREAKGDWGPLNSALVGAEPDEPGGPWTLGLGLDSEPGVGHVVVGLPKVPGFLDLALPQINRPLKGIQYEPSAFGCRVVFLTTPGERATFATPSGLLLYKRLARHRYRQSPNWARKSRLGADVIPYLTAQVIKQIEGTA